MWMVETRRIDPLRKRQWDGQMRYSSAKRVLSSYVLVNQIECRFVARYAYGRVMMTLTSIG
jgi:hypothetical protein